MESNSPANAARIKQLPLNKKGRDFVVGDIHGHFDLLEKALRKVDFDPDRDRLIAVGDLINRGPFSARCIEFLEKPWFFAVRGNHDQDFLKLYETGFADQEKMKSGMEWISSETAETLHKVYEALRKLPYAIEFETKKGLVGVVHADIPEDLSWNQFKQALLQGNSAVLQSAVYDRTRIQSERKSDIEGVWRVYLGHTIQKKGVTRLGNSFYIDTGIAKRKENGEVRKKLGLTFVQAAARKSDLKRKKKRSKTLRVIRRRNP